MQIRLAAPVVVLMAAANCMVYVALGAYVRGNSEKPLRRAASSIQRGKPAQARDALKWLLWFDPSHPEALHVTGLSYVHEQNLPAAIEHLERVDEDSASHEDAQIRMTAIRSLRAVAYDLFDHYERLAEDSSATVRRAPLVCSDWAASFAFARRSRVRPIRPCFFSSSVLAWRAESGALALRLQQRSSCLWS